SDLDCNIPIGVVLVAHRQPREHDHLAGKLQNGHRLAHIQHEHITTLPHGARLDHQLRRLWNGHEVTGDLRVGHRHRPAPADLLTEPRNYRARRPQHVTEPHHGKTGTVHLTHSRILTPQARRLLMTEGLEHHLRQTL